MWLVALGQRCPRRQSAGALAVGVLDRRTLGLRSGLGRPGDDPGGPHRPRAPRHRRGVGLRRAWPRCFCCSPCWCGAACRIAASAGTHFGFFLALGLASLVAFEMLLITAGVLGVLPLSGVVSPFLSSGNTAMLANFFVFALMLSVAARPGDGGSRGSAGRPRAPSAAGAGRGALVLLGIAAYYQVFHDREYLAREARSYEAGRRQARAAQSAAQFDRPRDSARQHPRPQRPARWPPATGMNWNATAPNTRRWASAIDQACSRLDIAPLSLRRATAHIAGDLRTGENFHATNASLVEHDANRKLQGYEYAELASADALPASARQPRARAHPGARPQRRTRARHAPATPRRRRSCGSTCARPPAARARWWSCRPEPATCWPW